MTGTWSEGRSADRKSLQIFAFETRGKMSELTQTWSSRRPLSFVCQLGLR